MISFTDGFIQAAKEEGTDDTVSQQIEPKLYTIISTGDHVNTGIKDYLFNAKSFFFLFFSNQNSTVLQFSKEMYIAKKR